MDRYEVLVPMRIALALATEMKIPRLLLTTLLVASLPGCGGIPSVRDDVTGDGLTVPTLVGVAEGEMEIRLFGAVDNNDAIGVANALAQGAKVDTVDIYGSTPLMWASSRGQEDVVALLLEYGADPNYLNSLLRTNPLIVAAQFGQGNVIRQLVEAGADIDASPIGDTQAIHIAVAHNQPESIHALAEMGADVNSIDRRPPIVLAAQYGWVEAATALLEEGADPLIVFSGSNTAAGIARGFGFPEVAEVIESYYPENRDTDD